MKHYEGSFPGWHQQRPPGPLPLEMVAHLIRQAATILQNAHNQGVVHQNITLDRFFVRATDEQPDFPDLLITGFGQSQGTPLWMAPEQWQGTAIPASDQYALAIIAYQLLTWRSPFQGNQDQLRYQHLNVQPEPPGRFNPRISPALESVIMRALAKRPEERYPNITAFANAFLQASQVSSTGAPLSTSALANQAIAAPANRRTLVSSMIREMLVLAMVFILVVSGIGFGFYAILKQNQAVAIDTTVFPSPDSTSTKSFATTVTSKTPLFVDSLRSDDGRWDRNAGCVFTGGTYHDLVQQAGQFWVCKLIGSHYGDVAIQVDVSLLAGYYTGLVFRFAGSASTLRFYIVSITKQGDFFFGKYSNGSLAPLILIPKTNAIESAHQKNTLLVIAKGSDFKVYIHGMFLGEAHDSDFSNGEIGFMIVTLDSDTRGDASFVNFKLYNV